MKNETTKWLDLLPKELEGIRGKLTLERALVSRDAKRLLVSLLSGVLVDEPEYLLIRRALAKAFPAMYVSLRVASPALEPEVRCDVAAFAPFLSRCLCRGAPGMKPFLEDAVWALEGKRVTLSLRQNEGLRYLRAADADERLRAIFHDVFRMEIEVLLSCEEDVAAQKKRLEELDARAEALVREQMERAEAARREQEARASTEAKSIYGQEITEAPTPLSDVDDQTRAVAVRGEVISVEVKELNGGLGRLVAFDLADEFGAIGCKLMLYYRPRPKKGEPAPTTPPTPKQIAAVDAVAARVKPGVWLLARGECGYDSYARETILRVYALCEASAPERIDAAPEKRVELHMHTQMSSMDALSSATALIEQAAKWGHPAVAITDHGVVQAFPEAFAAAKQHGIKLIPGMEGYLTDEATLVENADDRPLTGDVVVLDFETTGLNPKRDRVTEIGAARLRGENVVEELSLLIDPETTVPGKVTELTGITQAMLSGQPKFADVADRLLAFIGDAPIAAHNAAFDAAFLKNELLRCGRSWEGAVIDTLAFARKLYPRLGRHNLGALCRHLKISLKNAHRAVHDAKATAQALAKMLAVAREKGVRTLDALNSAFSGGAIGESHHVTLLAINQQGVTNLNRLVSEGHLTHFHRRPHLPRALLQKHREGILVGSACESGEVFRAVLEEKDSTALMRTVRFYDFLEVQPVENNAFLVREGRVKDIGALREINRKIVKLGRKHGIPVVATGDVHFLRPSDAVGRAVLQAGMGYKDVDDQPPLYFKTTDEMLAEFSYLGEQRAQEIVVDNPRKIAERVGEIRLFPAHPEGKETFQPFWKDAADEIKGMAWGEARRRYGEALPSIVESRLNKELGSIIGYGFATLYAIAQKLVAKSLSDGYLVGSRGSVGSSLVATMCGVTEVNPLPPHYLCPKCKWSHFDERREIASTGVDLPQMLCPVCGADCLREGYDIPFEVFLGFKGDKVPDIDLNFSGVYQPRAHKYVEELFGEGHVFRAGTINTLADKNARGFAMKYLEETEKTATEAEKRRLAALCVGVKRTTGQHPGGIVVLPMDYEIYQFTAIQHPANDAESDVVTTHYDFASMHDILVKLDILGHDDPTMLNMLERLTGVNPLDIPIGDPGVMSLFTSPNALGVTSEAIRCPTGTLGVPEFGTRFVRQMLEDTHPRAMEELVRISGLSHGTDVWTGNAQELIRRGTATLSECICARDDIMNALMARGVEPKTAFDTMESVRKGKGLTPAMEKTMREAKMPGWFIESCKKIKYLFPRSHAVAYVTMALRVAWYKVYRPVDYYAAYYTVRADAFDIGLIGLPEAALKEALDGYEARWKHLTNTEKEQMVIAEVALEMNARGIRLLPIDLYESDAEAFRIIGGNILPPFTSIPGLGLAAAQSLAAAREAGPYMSVEDLKLRARVSSAVMEQLRALGALRDLAETSQVTLFQDL